MAVVLSSEENSYFSASALRRSHSQPKFAAKPSGGAFHTSSSTGRLGSETYSHPVKSYSDSAPSSAPSSPRTNHVESTDLSWASTPSSNVSIAPSEDYDETLVVHPDTHFVLPHYESVGPASYFRSRSLNHQTDEEDEDLEPPTSPRTGDSYTVSPAENETSANTSRPDSPDVIEPSADDTALRAQPSRHVDYLSHNWKEEDIWSSWRYIISRRSDYSNAARLENASWRTWMKAKNKLKTVSPETLNWLKDCDVTWLYGPLQTGTTDGIVPSETDPNSAKLSRTNSFVNKKPILKKRSMSEVMLQRSLSNSSLVKQAAAAVQAQEKTEGGRRLTRPSIVRATTDYVTFPFSSRRMSRENSLWPSSTSSGITSPSGERRHIHFNEQVEQCIAVDMREDDEEEDDLDGQHYGDSDSDDGMLMMARTRRRRMPRSRRRVNTRRASTTEGKTIAMLPSTTLKYREDSPSSHETAMKHSVLRSPVISPSSSQETLRPTKGKKPSNGSSKFAFGDDDEDEDEDAQDDDDAPPAFSRGWQSPTKGGSNGPQNSPSVGPDERPAASGSLQRSPSANSLNAEPAGMRRTASGMFMPYEEGESSATEGIFGRVIDTVNTARDIAHVIWNVGWRK